MLAATMIICDALEVTLPCYKSHCHAHTLNLHQFTTFTLVEIKKGKNKTTHLNVFCSASVKASCNRSLSGAVLSIHSITPSLWQQPLNTNTDVILRPDIH